jgi:hypothetical protein
MWDAGEARTGAARRVLVAFIACAVTLLLPATALASNHLVKLRELYPGSSGQVQDEYVEVQLYESGENFFANNISLDFYNASGTMTYSFAPTTLDGNPPNGQSQRRVLFATATAQSDMGFTADYTIAQADHMANSGGAVCYVPSTAGFTDCVSWGNFSGSLPSPTGGNVDSSFGIPTNVTAIDRSIARGCPTLLEGTDDTNSPSNWTDGAPDPLNNADTPHEHECNTIITKAPKRRTTDRTPTFKFRATSNPATFKCKLDKKPFKSCTSPDTLHRLKLGKHTFKVRAKSGGFTDPTPARKTFKVIKKHH